MSTEEELDYVDPILEDTEDQPVEESTEDQVTDEISQETQEEDSEEPLAQVAFEAFLERGYLTEDTDKPFDGTFDWIESQLNELPNKLKGELINSVPVGQDLMEFMLESGPNLTRDKLAEFYRDYLSDETPDVSTVDAAREYLTKVYMDKGIDEDAIPSMLDTLEDKGTIVTAAEKALEKAEPKTKQAIAEVKQATTQQIANQKAWEDQVTAQIQALPKAVAQEVHNTSVNANKIFAEITSKPESYVELMKVLRLWKNGKFDFTNFEKQAETKAISKIKEKMQASNISSASKSKATNKQISDDEWEYAPPIRK